MKIKKWITLLLILVAFINAGAQSKKEVKKLKIKSVAVSITEVVSGKEKTVNETFKRFDNDANDWKILNIIKMELLKRKWFANSIKTMM